jgi:ClpP class serine protease
MTRWLLPPNEAERIRAIDEAVLSSSANFAGLKVTSEAIPMTVSYGIATIHVTGLLVKDRDPILDYFGIAHTAYSEVSAQVREAEQRGAKRGVIHFDSPGGQVVNDLGTAMDDIRESSIQWKSMAGDLLASAAYMLASQAKGGIYAGHEMSLVGSIGVAASVYMSSYRKEIANTDSPKKRPDVATSEGQDMIREELDDIFGVLAEKMAKGRGVSTDAIRNDYGQGAVMTAKTALSKKIIDGIESGRSRNKKPASGTQAATVGGNTMDLETLKREHPATYQAAIDAGIEQGVKKERARAAEHVSFAKGSKLYEAAMDDIVNGTEATMAVVHKHLDAQYRNQASGSRGEEAPPPVGGGDDSQPVGATKEQTQAAFAALNGKSGWTLEIGG